jgi:ATP-dependent HslUV protease subunit HslV
LAILFGLTIVKDNDYSLTITGNGDVVEHTDRIVAIGSGGSYALAGMYN